MKNLVLIVLIMAVNFATIQVLQAQVNLAKFWDKTIGGNQEEELHDFQQTPDGGYILGGFSYSGVSGNKSQASKGQTDYWVVKLDSNGNKQWNKAFGGDWFDKLSCLQQTTDGGYILGGSSWSGSNGDKSQPSRGFSDYWIVKLDATGKKLWDKTFGGDSTDMLTSLQQTSDGGYILAGWSNSGISSDKSEPNKGVWMDYWILKIDGSGNKLWDKTFGGNQRDFPEKIRQTPDGGYIVGGGSTSGISGDKSQASRGYDDYWILKLDANGNKQWDKAFGGNYNDWFLDLTLTTDGGYLIAGSSNSSPSVDKSQSSKGQSDNWVLKLDASGNKKWDRIYGGSEWDILTSINATSDGGFILCGHSDSGVSGDRSEPIIGRGDFWAVKIDSAGNKLWDKTIGGYQNEHFPYVVQTADGSYAFAGYSNSVVGGHKSESSLGLEDYWVIKMAAPCSELTATLTTTCGNYTAVSVNISGLQPAVTGIPAWTLTYAENGVVKTLSGSTPSSILTQNAVPGTIYSLISISSGSCTTSLHSIITIQSSPIAPIVASGNECEEEPITLSATGAPGGGSYALYDVALGGKPLETSSSGIFTIPNLSTTVPYFVSTTNNAGCEGPRTEIVVSSKPCPKPFLPNIITQNHDSKNDIFKPQNLPTGKWQLQVYNRWGVNIYESKDYQNNWPEKEIANATYYYLLSNPETGKQYKGWLEVTE